MKEPLVSRLSLYLYDTWVNEKKAEGYHLPEYCPDFDHDEESKVNDDLIHCHLCLADLAGFDQLAKNVRDDYLKKAETMIEDLKKYQIRISDLN
jgi:hypothetical protein